MDHWYVAIEQLREYVGSFEPPTAARDADSFEAALKGVLPATDSGRLLDAGCGRCAARQSAVERGYAYIGIDIETGGSCRASVVALPFADRSFDAAVCRSVLQYVASPAIALAELRRVLRPGATLVGNVAFLEPWAWGGRVHHTPAGIVMSLREAGFHTTNLWAGWRVEDALQTASNRLVGAAPSTSWPVAARKRRNEPDIALAFAASINFIAI
jgi:SAM-dependent methyltransferase